jgi:putative ABC transport system substrate-binding protein
MGTETALLFQRLTRSIPIVFAFSPDPLREGLVKSYQRPGGNLTGTSSRWYELLGKRLELIKEIRPSATKVALLLGPRSELALEQLFIDAPRLGLTLVQIDLGKGQVARAKSSEAASREEVAEAVRHCGASAFMFINFYGISEDMTWIQRQTGIPGVFSHPGAARGGGLLSLGISEADQLKRAAVIVSRVLQGESPSVIPVDQASSFNLIVNLAAARELKLEIPASVRLRANQVIE